MSEKQKEQLLLAMYAQVLRNENILIRIAEKVGVPKAEDLEYHSGEALSKHFDNINDFLDKFK